jgi:hypothetical protein
VSLEEIINIIIILLFFVVGPLLRRLRVGGQKKEEAEELPRPRAEEPFGPPASQTAEIRAYFERHLSDNRAAALQLLAQANASPLLRVPRFRHVAAALVARIRHHAEQARSIVDDALVRLDSQGILGVADMSRAIDVAAAEIGTARAGANVLSTLSTQRLASGATAQRLEHMDELLAELTQDRERSRLAIIWDGSPAAPPGLVGPGPAGLVPISPRRLRSATGWAELAQGLGFDVLVQWGGLLEEMRRKARVGPLAEQEPRPGHAASYSFDPSTAVSAWMPWLAADLVGATVSGTAYPAALVESHLNRRGSGLEAVTINTLSGAYDPKPPLIVRLAALDRYLVRRGWRDLGARDQLAARTDLPRYAVYRMPNRQARRYQLRPLLSIVEKVVGELGTTTFESAANRTLADIAAPRLEGADLTRINRVRQAFRADRQPVGSRLALFLGAILAEADRQSEVRYLEPMLETLEQLRRPAAAPAVAEESGRALLRDAIILSEIL